LPPRAKRDNIDVTIRRIDADTAMNIQIHSAAAALMFCAACTVQAAPTDASKSAADACETAVAETVRAARGRDAQEVQFIGAKRALSPTPGDETGVKGEGRYRGKSGGSMPFTYSCAFNASTGGTTGVMFSDKGAVPSIAERAWQPDLTNISPEACEVATAAALKGKYPRVDRITFGSDSRQLRPAADAHTLLEGQGGVAHAPGMNSVPFTYRCEFENRSGKIVGVKTSE
jgi:hypothetical protein